MGVAEDQGILGSTQFGGGAERMGNQAEDHKTSGTRGVTEAFERFFHSQVNGSVVLMVCTVAALAWANSPWAESYFDLLHTYIGVSWGDGVFKLSLQHWVNDALMVLFFFVVGLEIKREFVLGHLSSVRQAALPVAAAVGGMVVPALIYFALNASGDGARGWGIPMATDIAFALGILALFGKRVPIGLKVFLTALAIADDLGAVMVIAVFYTEKIRWSALAVAGVFFAAGFVLRKLRIRRIGFAMILITAFWAAIFVSGVHATVAGILAAMLVPMKPRKEPAEAAGRIERRLKEIRADNPGREDMVLDENQLDRLDDIYDTVIAMRPLGITLEHYFHPVQAFLVLPLFAFFNAGVAIDGRVIHTLLSPVGLGVVLGLFLGKKAGIFLMSWLIIRSGKASLPEGVTWGMLSGAGTLAGIGFTMSLFVTELAFKDPVLINEAKVGVLAASVISAAVGYFILNKCLPRKTE
jgi:NhaA family Na+:H+ antiporter